MTTILAEYKGVSQDYCLEIPSGMELRASISNSLGIDKNLIQLCMDSNIISNEDMLDNYAIVRITLLGALCGGKGGFGALLRLKAKQKGPKKTTDFGSCRDLNGRRLRHVNDELILQKWKEAKDKGEELNVSQQTKSGIDLWFLATPSWADNVGKKKRTQTGWKTRICSDWAKAREGRSAPEGSPSWWGCPRGRQCRFAHGESELQGTALEASRQQALAEKQEQELVERQSYVGSAEFSDSASHDAAVDELVRSGLRASKRMKADTEDADGPSSVSQEEFFQWEWIQVLSGEANILGHKIVGASEFATVAVMPDMPVPVGLWFLEVTVLTGGLVQIGWGDEVFRRTVAAEGDGVGDDQHSWAYDGLRKKLWHGGSNEYGDYAIDLAKKDRTHSDEWTSIDSWNAGDVIGCLVEIRCSNINGASSDPLCDASVRFTLNGNYLGFGASCECHNGNNGFGLFPAMSLNENEEVFINIGQNSFKFPPRRPADYWTSPPRPGLLQESRISQPALSPDTDKEYVPLLDLYRNYREALRVEAISGLSPKVADPSPSNLVVEKVFDAVDLESAHFDSIASLERLGLEHLKFELNRRGLKTGGTLTERATRLFAIRGKSWAEIDEKLKQKAKK